MVHLNPEKTYSNKGERKNGISGLSELCTLNDESFFGGYI